MARSSQRHLLSSALLEGGGSRWSVSSGRSGDPESLSSFSARGYPVSAAESACSGQTRSKGAATEAGRLVTVEDLESPRDPFGICPGQRPLQPKGAASELGRLVTEEDLERDRDSLYGMCMQEVRRLETAAFERIKLAEEASSARMHNLQERLAGEVSQQLEDARRELKETLAMPRRELDAHRDQVVALRSMVEAEGPRRAADQGAVLASLRDNLEAEICRWTAEAADLRRDVAGVQWVGEQHGLLVADVAAIRRELSGLQNSQKHQATVAAEAGAAAASALQQEVEQLYAQHQAALGDLRSDVLEEQERQRVLDLDVEGSKKAVADVQGGLEALKGELAELRVELLLTVDAQKEQQSVQSEADRIAVSGLQQQLMSLEVAQTQGQHDHAERNSADIQSVVSALEECQETLCALLRRDVDEVRGEVDALRRQVDSDMFCLRALASEDSSLRRRLLAPFEDRAGLPHREGGTSAGSLVPTFGPCDRGGATPPATPRLEPDVGGPEIEVPPEPVVHDAPVTESGNRRLSGATVLPQTARPHIRISPSLRSKMEALISAVQGTLHEQVEGSLSQLSTRNVSADEGASALRGGMSSREG